LSVFTLKSVEGGVQLSIRAQPKASRNGLVGLHGDRLKVAVTAAPARGKANRALAEVLAHALGVRASAVRVVAGEHSRDKVIRIEGLSAEEARRRLDAFLGQTGRDA
jgi:uncharacterized protein (TIGR00251 family)